MIATPSRHTDPAPARERGVFPPGVGAILTVDLAAIVANWRLIRAKAAPAEVACVVKADAYGLGAARVARALAGAGCRRFYVSTLAEGLSLRGHLADAWIAVLHGVDGGEARACAEARLHPVLNSEAQLEAWEALGEAAPRPLLHVDTGMNRLGFDGHGWAALAADPDRVARLRPSHVMSHLACADTPAHPMNAAQRRRFEAAVAAIAPGAGRVVRSLANSSGVFLGPAMHMDEVRPGAALYGIAPTLDAPNPLSQPINLQAKILQVRDVDRGMSVGYGAAHRAWRSGRVAAIAVGYADGYLRALGDHGRAYIAGTPAPLVGRVSMDLATLDVSDVPADRARPGAAAELIGPHASLDALAAAAGTIGYELLTRLGPRLHRVYRGG